MSRPDSLLYSSSSLEHKLEFYIEKELERVIRQFTLLKRKTIEEIHQIKVYKQPSPKLH